MHATPLPAPSVQRSTAAPESDAAFGAGVAQNAGDRRSHERAPRHRWWSRLSVRLSLGVAALLATLALAVCVALAALWTCYSAHKSIGGLTDAEREAAAIGVAAREQYIHETHGILTKDRVHLSHDRQWASELDRHVAKLRPMVSADEGRLLDTVQAKSASLGAIFSSEIFPAAMADDLLKVRQGHDRAMQLVDDMVEASNRAGAVLMQQNETKMMRTLHGARLAGFAAAATTILAALLAVALAVVMVRGIVRPVASLNAAAARIGEGDLNAVAPPTGAAEFEELRFGLERMAARLREREARLLKAERLSGLGELAAGIAHELNNPLGVILGYVKTLRRAQVDAETADDLRIVEEEANQCRRIVEDLVAFAREPRLELSATDVPALVRDVVERLGRSGELLERTIEIVADDPVTANVDGTRVGQVVRNLVLNALAASPIESRVRVEVARDGSRVVIRVIDDGVGISSRDLPHLFEPFFSRRAGGTGLGLAVCHGLVTRHGGSIDVASVEGQGTTVTVTLPIESASGGHA